jgi:hypothetical protein
MLIIRLTINTQGFLEILMISGTLGLGLEFRL